MITIAPALVLLLLSGGLSAQEEGQVEGVGFLSDYSKLGPDPDGRLDLVYGNPDYPLGEVTGLLIEDLVFYFHPTEEGRTIGPEDADKMGELSRRFTETWREALAEEGIALVDEPGEGVVRCRVAITNLWRTKSAARAVPQARLIGAGRGGAAMEGECLDSISGEVVYEAVNSDKGTRKSGVTTWAGAQSAIRKWAADVALRMEKAESPGISR